MAYQQDGKSTRKNAHTLLLLLKGVRSAERPEILPKKILPSQNAKSLTAPEQNLLATNNGRDDVYTQH